MFYFFYFFQKWLFSPCTYMTRIVSYILLIFFFWSFLNNVSYISWKAVSKFAFLESVPVLSYPQVSAIFSTFKRNTINDIITHLSLDQIKTKYLVPRPSIEFVNPLFVHCCPYKNIWQIMNNRSNIQNKSRRFFLWN